MKAEALAAHKKKERDKREKKRQSILESLAGERERKRNERAEREKEAAKRAKAKKGEVRAAPRRKKKQIQTPDYKAIENQTALDRESKRKAELREKKMPEVQAIAKKHSISVGEKKKSELIKEIYSVECKL